MKYFANRQINVNTLTETGKDTLFTFYDNNKTIPLIHEKRLCSPASRAELWS